MDQEIEQPDEDNYPNSITPSSHDSDYTSLILSKNF